VRVYHNSSEETYLFNIGQPVDSIRVDPDNWVLNGLAGVQKTSPGKSGGIISVYPNPNGGSLIFEVAEEQEGTVTVEVFNTVNQLVSSRRYEGCLPYITYSVDMNGLARGIYFVRFRYKGRSEIKKVIIE